MACTPGSCGDCISFKHSMGPTNCDPCMDLGGEISSCEITEGLDNLFHSIGPKLSRMGHEDYRCFYIHNKSVTDTLRNTIVYFDGTGNQVPGKNGGAYHAIGVKLRDEIQQIAITGPLPPLEGEFFTLYVPSYFPTFDVYYDPNITKWVGNFQTAIRAVTGLQEVQVYVNETDTVGAPTDVTFTINFGGHDSRDRGHKGTSDHARWTQASKHQIELIQIISSNLSNVTATPSTFQEGSPVNTTAEIIPSEITPPNGIPFDYYFRGNPIRIGSLRPGEYVPIWIRRTLPFPDPSYGNLARLGQMAKLLDDFKIRVDATYP